MGKEFVGKVVLVGAANAGKTSLIAKFVTGEFPMNAQPSTQPAFSKKHITHKQGKVTLEIWDTAGQERYHSLSPLFYREANVGIVVYDVSDSQSLDKAREWVEELRRELGGGIGVILAGNKIDCPEAVTLQQAKEIADPLGAKVIETSARTGEGVDLLFYTCAGLIVEADASRAIQSQSQSKQTDLCKC